MPVSGLFGKSLPELKMPKPEAWALELRFRAQGPVMSGRMSMSKPLTNQRLPPKPLKTALAELIERCLPWKNP